MALYKTKETALKHLKDGRCFKNKSFDLFRDSREVVECAIEHDKTSIIPDMFKNDEGIAEILLSKRYFSHSHDVYQIISAGRELLNNPTFINKVLKANLHPVSCVNIYLVCGDDVKYNKDVCIQIVKKWISAILFVPDIMKTDYDILEVFAHQLKSVFFTMRGDKTSILHTLNLPDLDSDDLLEYIESARLKSSLESQLSIKEETKRTVKI